MSYDDESRSVLGAADDAREMTATRGWADLAKWVVEQAALETQAIERGIGSWDEYQRAVGRLDSFRKVLERPEYLVAEANAVIGGDN